MVKIKDAEQLSYAKEDNKYIIITLFVLFICSIVLWLIPRSTSDIFMALAGGRDVFSGNLGAPDEWSFTTKGRVWINQSWGSHTIFYIVQKFLGYSGLVGIKIILIGLCGFFIILAVKKRGMPIHLSILCSSIILISSHNYIDLRPNIMTLIFTSLLLWLLYQTIECPKLIWAAALTVFVWSNMHGGFMLGIGMICLWAICHILPSIHGEGISGFKRYWRYAAGALLSILCLVINPFGLDNLKYTFTAFNSSLSQSTPEWKPIWVKASFGTVIEFIVIIIFIIVLVLVRMLLLKKIEGSNVKELIFNRQDINVIVFEVLLSSYVILMAISSRRFIPLALIIMAPILGMQLMWLIRLTSWKWLTAALSCIVLIFASNLACNNLTLYSVFGNSYENRGSFFDQMHLVDRSFPSELVKFINDNHINGNIFCPWTWEGYIHWNSPEPKLFIGGRAQQVYDEETMEQYDLILSGNSTIETLQRNNVNYIAAPYEGLFMNLINTVIKQGKWVPLFVNGNSFLLANPECNSTKDLIAKAKKNELFYMNNVTEKITKAASDINSDIKSKQGEALQVLENVLQEKVSFWIYKVFTDALSKETDQNKAAQLEEFLRKELKRLENMDERNSPKKEVMLSRTRITVVLERYYNNNGMNDRAESLKDSLNKAQSLYKQGY